MWCVRERRDNVIDVNEPEVFAEFWWEAFRICTVRGAYEAAAFDPDSTYETRPYRKDSSGTRRNANRPKRKAKSQPQTPAKRKAPFFPKPRGRPRKGKTWDTSVGEWL